LRRWQTSFLAISVFGVKTLGLAFGVSTWQWPLSSHLLVEGIVSRFDLLQGENPDLAMLVKTGR
jgi:hypothetical protein